MSENKSRTILKMRPETFHKTTTLAGSVLLLVASAGMMWAGTLSDPIRLTLMIGLCCMATSFWSYIGLAKETRDERVCKVSTYAITQSWFLSLILIGWAAVIFTQYLKIQFNGIQGIGFALFVIMLMMLGELLYYHARGDIEE